MPGAALHLGLHLALQLGLQLGLAPRDEHGSGACVCGTLGGERRVASEYTIAVVLRLTREQQLERVTEAVTPRNRGCHPM